MKDTLCACNHWFEEHEGVGGACECGCPGFTFEPAFNTPDYIADRGGEHQQPCECALCESERGKRDRDRTMRAQPHCPKCGCDLHEGVCPEGCEQPADDEEGS